jgi:hypothetical protein
MLEIRLLQSSRNSLTIFKLITLERTSGLQRRGGKWSAHLHFLHLGRPSDRSENDLADSNNLDVHWRDVGQESVFGYRIYPAVLRS